MQIIFLNGVPDMFKLVSISEDCLVQVWNVSVSTGDITSHVQFQTLSPPVAAALINNRACVVSHDVSTHRSVTTMYDYMNKGTLSHRIVDDHESPVFSVIACHKLRIFATVAHDGVIKFWDEQNMLVSYIFTPYRPFQSHYFAAAHC